MPNDSFIFLGGEEGEIHISGLCPLISKYYTLSPFNPDFLIVLMYLSFKLDFES